MDLDYMMPIRSPRAGWEIFEQEFEAAYKYGGLWVPVVHPFVTGRLSRWDVVAQFLERVLDQADVWFAPMEEIAAHIENVVAEGVFDARHIKMPQYNSAVKF